VPTDRCAAASSAWCSTTSARNWRPLRWSASAATQATPRDFRRWGELEQYFRTIYKPYGFLSDAQWTLLTESSVRRLPDGHVTPHYDPAMVMQFTAHPADYDRWTEYDRIHIPVLCLRGAGSDLLLADTAEAMRDRGPRALVVTIAGCGHAPALNVPEQLDLVSRFLSGH
jgi:pimeloyl-ACP methyl ester carboxylesterase